MRHVTNVKYEQYYRRIKLRLFFRKPEGTRPLVMSRGKCEENIKMDTKPIVGLCHWVRLVGVMAHWCVLVKMVMKFRVYKKNRIPLSLIKCVCLDVFCTILLLRSALQP